MKSTKKIFRRRSPRSLRADSKQIGHRDAESRANAIRNYSADNHHFRHSRFADLRDSVAPWLVFGSLRLVLSLLPSAALRLALRNLPRSGQSRASLKSKPDKDYLVYVLSEAADKISLIRFGPAGARVDHEIPTGDMPIDIDGPHGIAISRDKQFYYVSLAHGRPFGSVWKYSTKDDRVLGRVTARLFPGHHGPLRRRQPALRRQFQPAWRHGAFVSFGGGH